MPVILILAVLIFAIVLSMIEVPEMLADKAYKDLWSFSILLGLGVILAILKCLNVNIPNPSDWIAWVYSPVSNFLKNIF